MIPITYLKGDATQPKGDGDKLIVHCCNDIGAWGAGFVMALSRRWKAPEREYHQWFKRTEPQLGEVQFVQVEDDIWVCNMIGQHKTGTHNGVPPIRYDAIKEGLMEIRSVIKRCRPHVLKSIHAPRFGAGLAGGEWKKIEMLLKSELSQYDIPVFIYDLG
jgi:O-acetyl-ADP-ribose deacetylase (regulator of RNase III)